MTADLEQRAKLVRVDAGLVQQLLTDEHRASVYDEALVCVDGLPVDAVFLRGWFDPANNQFCALFAHDDWPLVEDGQPYPILDVMYKRVTRGSV